MTVVESAVSPEKSELVQENLKHAIRMLDDAISSAKSDGWQMVFLNTATAVQTLGMMFQNLGIPEAASKLSEASHKIPKSVPRSLKGTLMDNARWNVYSNSEEARRSRFEEGAPADPTQNMNPEDSEKWKEMHDKHKDNFKSAADLPDNRFNQMVDSIRDNADNMLKQVAWLGGFESAIRQGHGRTLRGQLSEIGSLYRVLERRIPE